jgi:branched-chain amino acid transport system permease protein
MSAPDDIAPPPATVPLPTWRGPARAVPRKTGLAAAGLLVAALVAPFFLRGFLVFQLTMVMIYAIAILGLNLLTGIGGQFSLGHSAFFALGAYAAALLMEVAGWPYWAALPAASLLSGLAGVLFGLPAQRLANLYLALATYGLALAMPQILKLPPLEPWTGGVQGLLVAKPDPPFGLPLTQDQWLYDLTLVIGLGAYLAARNLVASRTGRAMMAIRDNPIAARAMGVDVERYKTLSFGVSALYAGLAGALAAIVVQFVAPDSFTFTLSVGLFVGLVVGGVGWLPGALAGGAFVLFVPNLAESVSKGLSGAVYGTLLILLVHGLPSGLGGLARAVRPHLRSGSRKT